MKNYTLGYALLRGLIKIPHSLFYKHITVWGKEHIAEDKPVIFAPNHQNALMDPLAMIFSTSRQIVFLARGDIFSHKILSEILHFLRIMPVYRQEQNGRSSLEKNKAVFSQSVAYLKQGGVFCLFPEGRYNPQRNLLPLKKGIPRIAFQALKLTDNELDIQIIPTGIYYENKLRSQTEMQIVYGKPIAVKDYIDAIAKNEQKAMLQLSKDMEKAIKPLILNIPNNEHYQAIDQIRDLFVARNYSLGRVSEKSIFKNSQAVINKFAGVKLDDALKIKIDTLYSEMLERKWNPEFLQKGISLSWLIIQSCLLLILTPMILLGYGLNLPLLILSRWLRTKVIKDPQFISSVNFVVGGVVGLVYFLMISLLISVFYGGIAFLFATILLPFLSYGSYRFLKIFKITTRKYAFLCSTEKSSLIKKFKDIEQELSGLI